MSADISDRLECAKRWATCAGEILLKRFGGRQDWNLKSERETVTEADLESEKYIIEQIETEFAEPVLSEEFHPDTKPTGPLWIIDPLDGTNNFSMGFPFFCVIIAYAIDGETRLGVIYEPIRKELFWTDGEKSYLGEERISVSDTLKLAESFAATGFPYNRGGKNETNLENFVRMTMAVRGVRRAGSAGLDLAYTAAGRFDIYWELGLKPWDLAAGEVMVRCAGGRTGLFDGSEWRIGYDRILAAAPGVFDKAANILTDGED